MNDHGDGGAADDAITGMAFTAAARLELNTVLEELVLRAREVQVTQGRLRGLLRAFLEVGRADSLDTVLLHVVEAAQQLVDARYAALGVVRRDRLVQFVHTGMDAGQVARIGRLPEGKGLLGLLVEHPQTLRLHAMTDHHASAGFPDGHPPMRTFLGVPIRDGGHVLGNLYLTDKRLGADFTRDDEQLVQALAAAAGSAITNAMLLHESRRRHAWQTAMIDVSTGLLAGADPGQALRELVRHARHTLSGVGAGITVPTDDAGTLRVAAAEGVHEASTGTLVPVTGSVSGCAVAAKRLVVIDDPGSDVRTAATADRTRAAAGQTVAVPLIADDEVTGVLSVSRKPGADPFDEVDLDLITAVAAHTGLALHLSRVRADEAQLRILEDRERIGDDLRQRVIHRLFAHGLELQATAARITESTARCGLQRQISEVDAIISDIRNVVLSFGDSRQWQAGPAQPPDDARSPRE